MKVLLRQAGCWALALLLLLGLAQPALAAQAQTPLIILQGYSGPQLFLDYGEESEQQIWFPSIDNTIMRSLADVLLYTLPKLIVDAGGNADKVVDKFSEIAPLIEKMQMNDDGTSKYNVTPAPQGARNSRWDVMLERGQERLNNQRAITNSMLSAVPASRIYCFASDWRRGQVEGTAALHKYIQEVKADSGSSKVNLFGISYGGQLATAYLTLYGGEDIERIVMHAPAIHGSQVAVDILEDKNFSFDPVILLEFAAVYLELELSLNQRFSGITMEQVSDIALEVIRTYLTSLIINFGSYWDVVPPEHYERLKAKHLDPVKNAEIIRRSDIIHYEVMPHAAETLRAWQAKGVKIALICGAGTPLIGGNMIDSDRIIPTQSTSGAAVRPLGSQGTAPKPEQPACTAPEHMHRSPDGSIDASCCYLPDHTWFFFGQYHGQAAWDGYASALYRKWLYTNEIQDVYSSPEYPQFRDSCNPSDGVEARFSGSVSGYLTAQDDTLLLKNLSEYEISLLSVQAEGIELDVSLINRVLLQPGETVRLRYNAQLPMQQKSFTLKVDYVRENLAPTTESRRFAFAAIPAQSPLPAALRYPPQEGENAATRAVPPIRLLFIAISLAASLGIASVAVGVMYRGKLRQRKKRKAKRHKT